MQPVHGTLWELWEALLYLEYCGVLDELSDPRSTLFVMETLTFLSPSQRRQDTGGPSELFWRKGALGAGQRHRKPQGTPQTAYNENPRLPRKAILEPDRTCSCLRIHYMGLGTCWGESQNEVQEFVAHAGGRARGSPNRRATLTTVC